MKNPGLWFGGGVAGAISVCCYIAAIVIPWPESQLGTSVSLLVVSGFPIPGIMASYALYHFVASERESVTNTFGLIFFVAAFRRSSRC